MTVQFQFDGQPPAPTRDAATVLVLREGDDGPEIFFVQRGAAQRFMGGAMVFPGGRLDAGDSAPDVACDLTPDEAARRLGEEDPARALGLHVAALRECLEESGLLLSVGDVSLDDARALRDALSPRDAPPVGPLLAARDVTLRTSALVPFARWVTPAQETRRFDARFFLAVAPAQRDHAVHDGGETVASVWMTARRAIARAEAGEIVLAPPTWRTLAELADARTVADAIARAPSRIDAREPSVQLVGDEVAVLLPDDPQHPAATAEPAPKHVPTRFLYRDGAWIAARADSPE